MYYSLLIIISILLGLLSFLKDIIELQIYLILWPMH